MNIYAWIGIILVILIILYLKFKMKEQKEDYIRECLDERLSEIQGSFSDVCKKFVGKLFGC